MKAAWTIPISLVLCLLATGAAAAQEKTRIKDVASLSGIEEVQLFGYGLVVGLAGTGDKSQTVFTSQTVANMLKNMGIELPDTYIRVKNVAAVIVTANLSPYKKKGTRFDVSVSSLGDATSLDGGTLILTPLQGPDALTYASAQGALTTGGIEARNGSANRYRRNHSLAGRIPDGAIVQKQFELNPLKGGDLSLSLSTPDFTSALSMTEAINLRFKDLAVGSIAHAVDAGTVRLEFGPFVQDSSTRKIEVVEFISLIENVEFDVASRARVVVNEKTGTIVAGGNVRISEVAVAHGGIKVEIVNIPEVVQPQPFSLGQTTVIPQPQMVVEEKEPDMVVMNGTTTVADLAQSLNSLGVSPRDVISIFQAIKEAGALQGQLIVL